jgi:hypothetical protein
MTAASGQRLEHESVECAVQQFRRRIGHKGAVRRCLDNQGMGLDGRVGWLVAEDCFFR